MENLPKRRHSRLKAYDYSRNGCYFITVCTKDREQRLSRIVGRGLAPADPVRPDLTRIGEILDTQIRALESCFPGIVIDHYVIMPNHFHVLLFIQETAGASPRPTVPSIVGALKSLTTRLANQLDDTPGRIIFQASYHDHIIRDDHDYSSHWSYIDANPALWAEDEYYSEITN